MITGSFLGFPLSREIETSFTGGGGSVLAKTIAEDLHFFVEKNRIATKGKAWNALTTEYHELKKIRLPFAPNGIIYWWVPVGQDAEGYARARELLTPPV